MIPKRRLVSFKDALQDVFFNLREVRRDESQAVIRVDSCIPIQESNGEVGQTSDFASHLPAVPPTLIVGYINFASSSERAGPETQRRVIPTEGPTLDQTIVVAKSWILAGIHRQY